VDADQIKELARLRMAIGYLGEQSKTGWWSSTFSGTNAKAFLGPVFPRTYVLAQLQGVTSAAAKLHDDRIGIGDVFHLFRLPEDLEQSLHAIQHEEILDLAASVTANLQSAMRCLSTCAEDRRNDAVGPVRIGHLAQLRDTPRWRDVACYYLGGFERDEEVFPFFSDSK